MLPLTSSANSNSKTFLLLHKVPQFTLCSRQSVSISSCTPLQNIDFLLVFFPTSSRFCVYCVTETHLSSCELNFVYVYMYVYEDSNFGGFRFPCVYVHAHKWLKHQILANIGYFRFSPYNIRNYYSFFFAVTFIIIWRPSP